MLSPAVLCSALLLVQAPARTLDLARLPGDAELAELVWSRSPDLVAARQRIGAARADVERSSLLPNPSVDLGWNTIPIGPTNPPGLDRLTEVPNYALTLSEQVELGKRGPRQEASGHALKASLLDATDLARQRYFDLLERISEIATAELRIAALTEVAQDAAHLTELQQQRQDRGDSAGLDTDRAVLDQEKLQANLGEEQGKLAAARLTCAQVVGMPCLPFGSAEKAAAFLGRRLAGAPAAPRVEERPDLQSLEAQQQGAKASAALAEAHLLPDPTFRAGFVYDRFLASGNQGQSVFVGVSVPLPLFDRGQADAATARATQASATQTRTLLQAQAEHDLQSLAEQTEQAQQRRAHLRERTLPLARSVVQRLDQAVRGGGAVLPDLLVARRTLSELLLDASDLDLLLFHLSITRSRTAGESPPLPDLSGSGS